jgi:hypothetical protein
MAVPPRVIRLTLVLDLDFANTNIVISALSGRLHRDILARGQLIRIAIRPFGIP